MDTTTPKKRLTKVAERIEHSPYRLSNNCLKAIVEAWADESIPYVYNQEKLKAELTEIVSLIARESRYLVYYQTCGEVSDSLMDMELEGESPNVD